MSDPAHAFAPTAFAALDGARPDEGRIGELPVGARLGRYRIRGRLGAGGMGVVYLAEETDTGRSLALKTLHERDPVALYRLKKEFRSLSDVSHRNLVSLGELATEGGLPFFTMELVDGIDFQSWADAGPLPTEPGYHERLRRGLRQIALGLRALHGAGKVHCDLKPSNILVTRDDRIVIVDFGLVRDRPAASHNSSSQVWGTALYMAPEQARTAQVGAPADWYSLGIMLYRILTGHHPFYGTNMEVLLDKQEREPPPPSDIADNVPPDLDALCAALLRRDPAQRPGSAEILDRLGAADEPAGPAPRDTSSMVLRSLFVGRLEELGLLQRELSGSRRQPTAVLLRGASGVGKTALVGHFLASVRHASRDAVLLDGRCYHRDSMPYRALDGVIDSLSDDLRRRDQVELAHRLPPDAALLGRVFPVLARVQAIARATAPSPEPGDQQQLRARVFAALRQLLSRLAERGPVVIFVDDLQWADADGLALLADLFHTPDAPRALLLGTVRAEADSELPRQLTELFRGIGRRTELPLTPLPPRDAEELTGMLLEQRAPEMLTSARAIASEAGGHPLFIDELVRYHVRSPERARGRGPALDAAIWQRLRNLDDSGRALMSVLAIAKLPLDLETASLAAGVPMELAERLARDLVADHLARAVPGAGGSRALAPYHDRGREVLVARLDGVARTEWHCRLAEALYRTGAARHAPLELVRHLTLAGERRRAAELSAAAADQAAAGLAFDSAAELYRLALEMGDQPAAVGRLRRSLAEALVNAGRGVEAAEVFEQLAATAADETVRADYLRRAAEQLLITGHIDRGLATLESVAMELGVRVPAGNYSALASLVWHRVQLRLRGMRWRLRAPEEVDERELLAQDAHHMVGSILALVDPVRGMALLSRASLMALRLGTRERVVRAISSEALTRAGVGDRRRAEALIQRATELAEEEGDPGLVTWVVGSAGIVSYALGQFDQVLPAVDQALAMHASLSGTERARLSSGGTYETTVLRQCRLLSLGLLGRCSELRRDYHELLRDARRRGDRFTAANVTRGVNTVWLLADDPERARAELAAVQWEPPGDTFHVQHWAALRSMVQLHLYCGTGDRARRELADEIARSRRSPLNRLATLRSEQQWLLGRLGLAESEAAPSGSSAAGRGQKEALAAARRLDRLGMPHSATAAALLRAAVRHQRGDLRGCLADLIRAEELSSRHGYRLLQAAARRRRGELIGGAAGAELIAGVDGWARGEEIRRPDRIVRMYSPGFDRR